MFKSKLEISSYEGLITVLAVIIAVEYSGGFYDLWDVFTGLISILIGTKYWVLAKGKNDFLYNLLTVSLIALGVVSAVTGVIFFIGSFFGFSNQQGIESFRAENIRFAIFVFISAGLYWKLSRVSTHNKPMQLTADVSAD